MLSRPAVIAPYVFLLWLAMLLVALPIAGQESRQACLGRAVALLCHARCGFLVGPAGTLNGLWPCPCACLWASVLVKSWPDQCVEHSSLKAEEGTASHCQPVEKRGLAWFEVEKGCQ